MEKGSEQFSWLGISLVIVGIIVASFFIDLKSLNVWVERAGIWGPLVFILLKISTIVIAPLSGSALYPLVGILFGFWPGILYVVVGDMVGFSINFWLSRKFGRKIVFRFISSKEEGVVNRTIEHVGATKGLFYASLTLFAMPELVAYAAGLSKISYTQFILILGTLNTLGSVILVLGGSLIAEGNQAGFLSFTLPLLGIVAFLVGGILFSKGIKKKEAGGNFR